MCTYKINALITSSQDYTRPLYLKQLCLSKHFARFEIESLEQF